MQLRANNLSLQRAGRSLVSNVNLVIDAGELIGLIGPNGAGKSTLLSMLAGLLNADQGEIRLDNIPLQAMSAQLKSQLLAWVEQSGPINWPLSVERIVTLGRRPHMGPWQRLSDADRIAIEQAIIDTDCQHLRQQDATTLSGGERTRMLLARALAAEPRILLADEPIATLDLGHQLQTMELLRRFSNQERCCLVVLHDLSLAARFCDRLYLMDQGCLVAHGLPQEVLSDDILATVYGVEVASGFAEVPWIVPVRRL